VNEQPVTRCAVLGSPISHSLSPALHRAAYEHLGLDWRYGAVELVEDQLADYLARRSVRGVSVTMPLKQVALAMAAEADPVAVTVRGDQAALAPLSRIDTAPIDVGGLTANRSYRVALVLPAGVTLIAPTDAVVGVTVAPLTGTRPFPLVAVTVTGLAPNLVADLDVRTVDLVVAGPVPTLTALAPDAVSATVDAAGKGVGTYPVDIAVRVTAGLGAQAVQPTRATLTIRSR